MIAMTPTLTIAEDISIVVNVTIDVLNARTLKLVRRLHGHNLVTNAGLAAYAAGLTGVAPEVTHLGIGSGNTAAAAGDTAMETELSKPTITRVSSAAGVATAQYYLSSALLNGSNLREIGLFANTSTLLARYVFVDADLQPKTSAVAAVVTWTQTFARL